MSSAENKFNHIDRSFNIIQNKVESSFSMPSNHYHDAYEIYYLMEGERYYFIKDRTYHVIKGDIVFINIYDLHKTLNVSSSSHVRILINFKKDFIEKALQDYKDIDILQCFGSGINVIRPSIAEQANTEALLNRMLAEERKKQYGYNSYLKLLLCELLIFINRHIKKNPVNTFEYANPVHKKMSEIASYINAHYQESLSLNKLSSKFYISPYYLSRSFKEATGFSFVEYLNSVRIKEAQKLLRETSSNITEVAEKVGYDSISHFGRVFKDIAGVSPLKYRKSFLT